jgi:tetratricopeptide (TPR) repeat protein
MTPFSAILVVALLLPVAQAGGSPTRERDAMIKSASAAVAAGRRAEAKDLLRGAAEKYKSVQAYLLLARLQSGEGDAAGALETLRKARTLAPNSEDVLSAFAQVSLAARMPLPAIETLRSLVRLCPTVAQYQYLLGVGLLSSGDALSAVAPLTKADELEADRPQTLTALGLAYNNQKQFADAKARLERSLELDPENVDTLAALAEAEAGAGDTGAAETHAARALTMTPAHPTANLVIGMVRMSQQRYPEARDALLAAAAADPHSPKPEYQLSLVFARLGDEAAAQRHIDLYREKLREMEQAVKALHQGAATAKASGRQ